MYKTITKCRISGSTNLIPIVSLGEQHLTGIFPKSVETGITKGPVDLVWCPESCLVQMKQTYDLKEMYGDNYGYRSGLNNSMVIHLQNKAKSLLNFVQPKDGDIVLDIGSNDATSLKAYPSNLKRIGIDPTGTKFRDYYPAEIELVSDFFRAELFRQVFPGKKAKIVSSIAMFYDLEDPVNFASEIASILDDDGVWHFEQSYLPSMLRTNSYDTICQEHLEYYSLTSVLYILEKAQLNVIDVWLNDINGGSFAVTAAKNSSNFIQNKAVVNWMLEEELRMGLNTIKPYIDFNERINNHKESLLALLNNLKSAGKRILGYGASTKGNVLLQYCGIDTKFLDAISDVNENKYNHFTPGTNIPIISEKDANELNPDYYLVLPWHFKNNILARETEFRMRSGKFIFPFPFVEIV